MTTIKAILMIEELNTLMNGGEIDLLDLDNYNLKIKVKGIKVK